MKAALRGTLQDGLRRLIGEGLVFAGHLLKIRHDRRIEIYRRTQDGLRLRYGIEPSTPIRAWGPEVQAEIEAWAEQQPKPVRFAETSGSTAAPKRLAYPRRRVLGVQWAFIEAFCRLYASRPDLTRHSMYVFAALDGDDSLTGMMLEEGAGPSYVSTLQAPYRVHHTPPMQRLAEIYGTDAARLWVLTLSNPGVLYATNPSTLSTFFDRLAADWPRHRRLLADWRADPERFEAGVRRTARRLSSRGARRRVADLAAASACPDVAHLLPAAQLFVCWDGGYLRPFLDRLDAHLDPAQHRRLPMYSMSTETLETVPHFAAPGRQAFLPLAPGVLYELLPEAAPDEPRHLVPPWQARPKEAYTLVVSDPYGLRRYQTGDLFECRAMQDGLPDLRFSRRRDLEHSFTGEKLTATQVQAALHEVRSGGVGLEDVYFALVPTAASDAPAPGYLLVVLQDADLGAPVRACLAEATDRALGAQNREYAHKRATKRLSPIEVRALPARTFARLAGGGASWESQFKFLPLYRKTWQAMQRGDTPISRPSR